MPVSILVYLIIGSVAALCFNVMLTKDGIKLPFISKILRYSLIILWLPLLIWIMATT